MATIAHKMRFGVDVDAHPELKRLAEPAHQAYRVLHIGFVVLPLIAGLDKFTHLLCDWTQYLAPVFPNLLGVSKQTFMLGVGVIEIAAAFIVLAVPYVGAWVVMGWLWAIIVNLLLLHGYYDVALRDFGLSLGALALGLLAIGYHRQQQQQQQQQQTPPA
jgi:hypothetical protein